MRHALDQGLHVQDATYLETARRTGAALISADQAQLDAATRMGLTTVSLGDVRAREP
jgi:predicted nucleic acid-binding protein